MTILAQLHDCHSCYDERSIDQKKKVSAMHTQVSPKLDFVKPKSSPAERLVKMGQPFMDTLENITLFSEEDKHCQNSGDFDKYSFYSRSYD